MTRSLCLANGLRSCPPPAFLLLLALIASCLLASQARSQTPSPTTPPPVLSVKEPPPPTPAYGSSQAEYTNVPAIRQADGTYIIHKTMKSVKGLKVYRNGMRMKPGQDYSYDPTTGIIAPLSVTVAPWSSEDTVLLDFAI